MVTKELIGELKIKPNESSRFLLGSFNEDISPTGYSLRITPESELDCVTSSVVSVDKKNGIRQLVMNIENFGSKTIKAQIWPI